LYNEINEEKHKLVHTIFFAEEEEEEEGSHNK
jgi:hypothetical protein